MSSRSRRALLAIAAAAVAIPAAPASAATVALKISDPAGDGTGGAALEITSATITQDTAKGSVTATVAFGAAPSSTASLAIGLGKLKDGACVIGTEGDGSMAFLIAFDPSLAGIWAVDGDAQSHPVTPTLSGSTLKVTSGSASSLKKLSWNCASVSVQAPGANEGESVGDSAVSGGASAGGSQVVITTDKPDGDKDGVPDVADACPTVAGASANGCLTIAANFALRLGAKRVAVDMLVPMTGTTCKAVAKATVKAGSKTIGKGTLDVGVHGSFCHISGAVKTKKHGKSVKIKITGSGFKAISATVK
jgi:hypothetical protein